MGITNVVFWDRFDIPISEASRWAEENCPNFLSSSHLDLSDVNHSKGDYMIEFKFSDEKDAVLFVMRWA